MSDETKTSVGEEDGRVVILYSEPIAWISYEPDDADTLADAIKEHARRARQRQDLHGSADKV